MKNKLHNPVKSDVKKVCSILSLIQCERQLINSGLFQVPCRAKTTALEFDRAMSGVLTVKATFC